MRANVDGLTGFIIFPNVFQFCYLHGMEKVQRQRQGRRDSSLLDRQSTFFTGVYPWVAMVSASSMSLVVTALLHSMSLKLFVNKLYSEIDIFRVSNKLNEIIIKKIQSCAYATKRSKGHLLVLASTENHKKQANTI